MKMNSQYYKTSDLALATTISLSFSIESIDKTHPRRVFFVFRHDKDLDKLIKSYWRGELKVEPQAFFSQLKSIKTRIYAER